jgi:4'-phosphopantetheinyl transferase
MDRGGDDRMLDYTINDDEQQALADLDDAARSAAFLTYWTRKEALMKAAGKGLRIPLRSLTLSGPGEHARLVSSADGALSPRSTQLVDLDPGDGYRASVAVLTRAPIRVSQTWWDG